MDDRKDRLMKLFQKEGFDISESQADQFLEFNEMLVERNKVMNLTAITEFDEVTVRHFLDSVMLLKWIGDLFPDRKKENGFNEELELIDVGTGAGFPGLPLKIMYPDLSVTLLDALKKRIGFLEEVVSACGLSRAECIHSRAEDGVKDRRESYDLAVSRAVASLNILSEYCLPYVKPGGVFVSYKSGNITEEAEGAANALSVLGGKIERIERFTLPDGSERSLVMIRKIEETPAAYPRRAGKIEKKPL